MTQRLFQDAAGTIPAILAGQPVGLSIRAAGQQNASQATALSKPTLARWPMSGRRNLANGAQAVGDLSYWLDTQTNGGITFTKLGSGFENGEPYVDYRAQGTASSSTSSGMYAQSNSRVPAVEGDLFSSRFKVTLISAATSPADGVSFRSTVAAEQDVTFLGQAIQSEVVPLGAERTLQVSSALSFAGMTHARCEIGLTTVVGEVYDITFRIKVLQFERGLTQTPLQFNYGPNDITELGVADLWHLYNDGGDSLNVILPAGTYGSAHLAIDRSYNVGSVVSDGVTPLTTMTTERQIDAIYRLGEFSAGEREALLKYWQEEYPL